MTSNFPCKYLALMLCFPRFFFCWPAQIVEAAFSPGKSLSKLMKYLGSLGLSSSIHPTRKILHLGKVDADYTYGTFLTTFSLLAGSAGGRPKYRCQEKKFPQFLLFLPFLPPQFVTNMEIWENCTGFFYARDTWQNLNHVTQKWNSIWLIFNAGNGSKSTLKLVCKKKLRNSAITF